MVEPATPLDDPRRQVGMMGFGVMPATSRMRVSSHEILANIAHLVVLKIVPGFLLASRITTSTPWRVGSSAGCLPTATPDPTIRRRCCRHGKSSCSRSCCLHPLLWGGRGLQAGSPSISSKPRVDAVRLFPRDRAFLLEGPHRLVVRRAGDHVARGSSGEGAVLPIS